MAVTQTTLQVTMLPSTNNGETPITHYNLYIDARTTGFSYTKDRNGLTLTSSITLTTMKHYSLKAT